MRTIKFRGKRVDNGELAFGSLFNSIWKKSECGTKVCYIFPDDMLDRINGDCWEEFASVADEYEVDPQTVGQFTGLLDKDGKEIWEGDIVRRDNYDNYVVCYGPYNSHGSGTVPSDSFGWHVVGVSQYAIPSQEIHSIQGLAALFPSHCLDDERYAVPRFAFTIIGNIHDNPEHFNRQTK